MRLFPALMLHDEKVRALRFQAKSGRNSASTAGPSSRCHQRSREIEVFCGLHQRRPQLHFKSCALPCGPVHEQSLPDCWAGSLNHRRCAALPRSSEDAGTAQSRGRQPRPRIPSRLLTVRQRRVRYADTWRRPHASCLSWHTHGSDAATPRRSACQAGSRGAAHGVLRAAGERAPLRPARDAGPSRRDLELLDQCGSFHQGSGW